MLFLHPFDSSFSISDKIQPELSFPLGPPGQSTAGRSRIVHCTVKILFSRTPGLCSEPEVVEGEAGGEGRCRRDVASDQRCSAWAAHSEQLASSQARDPRGHWHWVRLGTCQFQCAARAGSLFSTKNPCVVGKRLCVMLTECRHLPAAKCLHICIWSPCTQSTIYGTPTMCHGYIMAGHSSQRHGALGQQSHN